MTSIKFVEDYTMTKFYTTGNSLIKQLLQEAEEFVLSPDESFDDPNADTGMGIGDINLQNNMSPQLGMTQAPQMQPVSMPQPDASTPTAVTKTVINSDLVLTHLSELKSIINNYEKRFGGDDIAVEDARVYISSFLNAMAYHSEKLQTFLNIDTKEPEPAETPELVDEPLMDEEPMGLGEPSLDISNEPSKQAEVPDINTDFDLDSENTDNTEDTEF